MHDEKREYKGSRKTLYFSVRELAFRKEEGSCREGRSKTICCISMGGKKKLKSSRGSNKKREGQRMAEFSDSKKGVTGALENKGGKQAHFAFKRGGEGNLISYKRIADGFDVVREV